MSDALGKVLFECESGLGMFRIWEEARGVLHFEQRLSPEEEWRPTQMRRTLRGRIATLHGDWPPERVTSLSPAGDGLELTYEDIFVPDERPFLARWREARWVARFDGRRWDVRRGGYLESIAAFRERTRRWGEPR